VNDQPLDDSMPVKPPALPPVNISPQLPDSPPPIAAWRWWLHLIILAGYVLGIGLLSATSDQTETGPGLPTHPVDLLLTLLIHLGIFGLFFGAAWAASRVNIDQLLLRWRRGWLPWLLGFGYSIAMRLVLGIIVLVVLVSATVIMVASSGEPWNRAAYEKVMEDLATQYKPDVETLVDKEAIQDSPIYLLLNVTLVSFVLAGFREELWRAAMLAGCKALFPALYAKRRGQVLCVIGIAIIFGIGHWSQGPGGVVLTTLLGVMLGLIMVFHRSVWEATLAHGFFNASSFVLMHLLFKYEDQFEQLQKYLPGQ
jgi:membrane protease YdiL (CAAX protease family)